MTEERKIIRRKRPNELVKLIRQLDKMAPAALTRLAELCKSKDEKVALDACKAIPKMIADFKDQAEQRELQMLLAQQKIGTLKRVEEDDEEDDTPLIVFDKIQDF